MRCGSMERKRWEGEGCAMASCGVCGGAYEEVVGGVRVAGGGVGVGRGGV